MLPYPSNLAASRSARPAAFARPEGGEGARSPGVLLDAAYTALARRPWSAVRMVDVAASAGVSRQTLYNEFGSKEDSPGPW